MENLLKSKKTLKRIEAITTELNSYYDGLNLLDGYASGRLVLEADDNSGLIKNPLRIRGYEKRYRWTREYLKKQIMLLEYELKVLEEYGE